MYPLGKGVVLYQTCMRLRVSLDDCDFDADLVVLYIHDFDIILGMGWLSAYIVHIDFTITFELPGKQGITVATVRWNAFVESFAHVVYGELELVLAHAPIFADFSDVFDEVPGLPPARAIKFYIEILPGTTPIHRFPYRMSVIVTIEIKRQPNKLLVSGFIRRVGLPRVLMCYL